MQNSLVERQVSADAFLVSKTDTKGKITYCNIPFAQIVGAQCSELIGKPHNIVRHPDMPRIIFKILWEHVKNKKEVFANVTASLDQNGNTIGYYSVRRKPNPKALEIIVPLYKQLLEAEKIGGIEASSRLLESVLKEKNKSYDELMNNLQRL